MADSECAGGWICYCFEHSEEDIRRDVLSSGGRSLIMEHIMAEKKAGTCRCETLNPTGH